MWDHNVHFHDSLLKQCPPDARHALDVGCGHGLLANRLTERAGTVDALDADSSVLCEAEKLCAGRNIRFVCADFLEADLPPAHYDFITAVASLHHMDAHKALVKMKRLLRPSGVLAVLGLYRERTWTDMAFAAASVPVDLFYLLRHRVAIPTESHPVPTRPPVMTLAQIRSAADSLLPGNVFQRRLLWRYSLTWRKPAAARQ